MPEPKISKKRQLELVDSFLNYEPDAVYWAGFLMADGCISRKSSRITLVIIDKDHLKKYCQFLGLPQTSIQKKGCPIKTTHSQQWVVKFAAPYLKLILATYGIIPNKSYEFIPPIVPNNRLKDFPRGWVDGDGHIRESGQIRLVGNQKALRWIESRVPRGWVSRKKYPPNKISGRIAFKKRVYEYLRAPLCLRRKW